MAAQSPLQAIMQRRKAQIRKGDVVHGQWRALKKLGEGSGGEVHLVEHTKNEKVRAAIKIEPMSDDKGDEILKMEAFVLARMQKSKHVCRLFLAGTCKNFNFMVISLLGKSLFELRLSQPRKRFTTATACRLSMQVLQALKDLHREGFIHRDVKPSNFAIGPVDATRRIIFMYDFGLCRQIFSTQDYVLRPPRQKVLFRGTVRYCSVNVHNYKEQGRHDDLISLMFMTIEFITGKLAWRGLYRRECGQAKENITDAALFEGCPQSLIMVYTHLKSCSYFDLPSYQTFYEILHQEMIAKGATKKDAFDWEAGGRYHEFQGRKGADYPGIDTDTCRGVRESPETIASDESGTETRGLNKDDTLDCVQDL